MRVIEDALGWFYDVNAPEEVTLRRRADPFPVGDLSGDWWFLPLGLLLLVGIAFVILMYVKDQRRIRWYWAVPLGLMRISVYFVIALIFLLPAKEVWKKEVKRSCVVVMLDVSGSMTLDGADPGPDGSPAASRMGRITDFLADERNVFFKNLLDTKNTVYVYRFGSKLDEESQGFKKALDKDGKVPKDENDKEIAEYLVLDGSGDTKETTDSVFTRAEPIVSAAILKALRGQTEGGVFHAPWNKADWTGFTTYDFKPWLLRGLSASGRDKVSRTTAFGGMKSGNATWALEWYEKNEADTIPDGDTTSDGKPLVEADRLSKEDAVILRTNREKLKARINLASTIATGTNVPGSVLKAIERESGNMVQGIVVFSDGRSNLGSDSTIAAVRSRAKAEKIPIFTVYIGEEKVTKSIRITDVQVPDQTPPDEPFKAIVEIDGEGFAGKTAKVALTLALEKDDSILQEFNGEVTFNTDEPPHAQLELIIDPLKVDNILKSTATANKELIEGKWIAYAKATIDDKRAGGKVEKLQSTSEKSIFRIEKKPLRTLVIATAGNRDFQFLFNQLTRDKADLSLYLQNEAGALGNASLLDDPQRLLKRFPDRIRVDADPNEKAEDRWYNLANYDIIIAFDPDWSLFTDDQVKLIQTWVDLQAGGFLMVCGPLHAKKLTFGDAQQKFQPLLDILPVVPGDYDLKMLARNPIEPRRLTFPGVGPDTDYMRLDDTKLDNPIGGWNRFFYGREDPPEGAKVLRGFFNYYPVKDVKVGANIVARYDDGLQARENTFDKKDPPFLVTYKYGQGMSAFLASSEMWRLRQLRPEGSEYFERFWTKLTRHLTAGSRKKQNRRGRILMSPVVLSGSYLRPRAELLDAGLQPLPPNSDPVIKIRPLELDTYPKDVMDIAKIKDNTKGSDVPAKDNDLDAFQKAKDKYHAELIKGQKLTMSAAKGDGTDKGWFQWQGLATAEKFPPGIWIAEVPIPSSSELLRAKFVIRRTNPELDILKPDIVAMARMADEVAEIEPRLSKKAAALKTIKENAYTGKEGTRLAYSFDRVEALNALPECLEAKEDPQSNKGATEDLWDRGPELPSWLTSWYDNKPYHVGWLMLLAIGLLSTEWLARKLLKLA